MSLYEEWMRLSYEKDGTSSARLWNDYLPREQKIYEHILGEKQSVLEDTVKSIAERFDMPIAYMCGFIDGINEVLPEKIDLEDIAPETVVKLEINFETLYKKMVEYKAKHLYTLPQWNHIFTDERQKELYTEQKKSKTVVNDIKIGRNDPCYCGSGKKYKKCCGV